MLIHNVERALRAILVIIKRYFSFYSGMKFGKGPACELKSLRNRVTFCVLLAVALLLYHDPFLLLWWPQQPAEVGWKFFLFHALQTCSLPVICVRKSREMI